MFVNRIISLQIIQLVEGRASAYVFASPGCKKWDTCAPEAILNAVGGANHQFCSSRGCFKHASFYSSLNRSLKCFFFLCRQTDWHAWQRVPLRCQCEAHELCRCPCDTTQPRALPRQSTAVSAASPQVRLRSVISRDDTNACGWFIDSALKVHTEKSFWTHMQ